MAAREITERERRMVAFLLDDPFVAAGHPLTCNGGNPDWRTHHDHEVRMLIDVPDDGDRPIALVCPECGRVQRLTVSSTEDEPPPETSASSPSS